MTLLTEKELDEAYAVKLSMHGDASEVARAQLRKIIAEIEVLRQKYIGIVFSYRLDCWLEAARKEIQGRTGSMEHLQRD